VGSVVVMAVAMAGSRIAPQAGRSGERCRGEARGVASAGLRSSGPIVRDAGLRPDLAVLLVATPISGCVLVGMGLGSAAVTMAGVLAAVMAAVLSPVVGLTILAIMAPLQPPLVVPAPGFNLVLVVAILLGSIYRLPIDRPRLSPGATPSLLLAFVLYVFLEQLPAMLAGYSGEHGHLAGYQFIQLLTGAGAAVAAGIVLQGRRPYPILVALLGSAVLAAGLAILTFENPGIGIPIVNLIPESGDPSRATGPFGNPNYFGVYLASAIAFGVGWLVAARSASGRIALVAAGTVLVVGIVLSFSRGATAALVAGIVLLSFAHRRGVGIASIVLGVVVVTLVYPTILGWRLGSPVEGPTDAALAALGGSDEGRLSAVLAGPALFASAPIFGIGFGQYSFMSGQVTGSHDLVGAHNWYMTVLAELGIVGIVLWLLLLVAVVMALRKRPAVPRTIGLGVLGVLAAGSLFLEPPTSFQTSALSLLVLTATLVADWSPGAGEVTDTGRRGGLPPRYRVPTGSRSVAGGTG
jgi:O-antigen ligase